MTPEKQRIKIAEACGWKGPHHPDNVKSMDGWWSQTRGTWWINPQGQRVMISDVPNYLNDLNAMHEAESVCIGTIHAKKHGQMLQEVTGWHCVGIVPDHARDLTHLSKLSRATAAQRAESFLKTLNLWES